MLPLGREAVRVRVIKFDCKLPPDVRKFSVDPQITSLEELRSIIATAFEIRDDFALCYKSSEQPDQDEYQALLTDWDLDTAFMRAQNASCLSGSEPCIHLKVDMKYGNPKEIHKSEPNLAKLQNRPQKSNSDAVNDLKQIQMGFQGMLMNHVEKTFSLVSKAFNLSDGADAPPRQPLSQSEFLSFLSPVGHVIHGEKLREAIYNGGVEPAFRKVAWKHILNVYPEGMSGKERLDYMKRKSAEYYSLRDVWRDSLHRGQMSPDLTYVTNMVRKDVLRTDRHHKFYSGTDDNQNVTTLFNILTTYALNHPTVSYCQGMSDLASPLLVVMENEAHSYICLCALMTRLHPNFLLDGEAMTLKFAHLTESLQIYDPIFYAYLQSHQADDLLFCYRWLLLEMKREFAFEDTLHMLEVLWSSIPSKPPEGELSLKEKEFIPEVLPNTSETPPISPLCKNARENAYSKLCAIRRQTSSYNFASTPKGKLFYKRMNQSLDENIGKGNIPTQLLKEFQSLDEPLLATCKEDNFKSDECKDLISNLSESNIKDINNSNPTEISKTAHIDHDAVNNKLFDPFSKSNQNDEKDSVISNGHDVMKCDISDGNSKVCTHFMNGNVQIKNDNMNKTNSINTSNVPHCDDVSTESVSNSSTLLMENKPSKDQISNVSNANRKSTDECFVWENPLHDNNVGTKTNPFIDYSPQQDTNLKKIGNNENTNTSQSNDTKSPLSSREIFKANSKFFSSMSQELENARKNCEILLQSNKHAANLQNIASTISSFQKKYENHSAESSFVTSSCEEINEQNVTKGITLLLPPATEFGGGNPFLIFLSLTLLMQHRDYIMRNQMDYNELAMYFDKMVRKHNVNRVLNQARQMYSSYLKDHPKEKN